MKHRRQLVPLALALALSGPAWAQEDAIEGAPLEGAEGAPPEGADGAPLEIDLPDDFHIGLIDMQRILQNSTAAVGVREEVGAREERYRAEIEQEEASLRAAQDDLAQQRGVLSPQEIAVQEAEFRAAVEALQKHVNERNAELQDLLASGIREIQEQVVRLVADVALERNLGLVFDTAVVVIAAEQIDISDEVVARLNELMPSVELPPPGGADSAGGGDGGAGAEGEAGG